MPLPASHGSWCPLAHGHITPVSASVGTLPPLTLHGFSSVSVYISLCFSLLRTFLLSCQDNLGHPHPQTLHYTCKDPFPYKVILSNSRDLNLKSGGNHYPNSYKISENLRFPPLPRFKGPSMLLKSRETLIPSLAGLQALCGISSWPHSSLTSTQPYQPSPPSESLKEIIFVMLYPRPRPTTS